MAADNLLAGLGQRSILTESELALYSRRWTEPLKSIGVLERFSSNVWFCDSCDDDHEYVVIGGQRFKACQNDISASFEPVPEEETIRWLVNWEKLKAQICLRNLLSPFSTPGISHAFPLGEGTGRLFFLIGVANGDQLASVTEILSCRYPGGELVLINTGRCIVDSQQQAMLQARNVRYVSIEELLANQWQFPINAGEATPALSPKVLVCRGKRTITVSGETCVFPSRQNFLFKTASIIIAAQDAIVSEEDFQTQYYQIGKKTSLESVAMRNYAGKAESLLRKHLSAILNGKTLLENVYGEGYRLHSDFCPAEIRS